MITYLNLKTNQRLPESGCNNGFDVGKKKYFIRGKGQLKFKEKEWKRKEIPDLAKPFSDQQFKDYIGQWGIDCAQEFLDCADIVKPIHAYQILNPPKNKEVWENPTILLWFKTLFKRDLFTFMDGYAWALGNSYQFDILKFERHLAFEFHYPKDQDGSISDWMIKTFGQENRDKFVNLFLKS